MRPLHRNDLHDTTQGRTAPIGPQLPEPSDRPLCLLSIDPGTEHSGWVLTEEYRIAEAGTETPNDECVHLIRSLPWDYLLIEEIVTAFAPPRGKGRGGQVGKSVFRTQLWVGSFFTHGLQVAPRHLSVRLLPRTDVARYYRPPGKSSGNDAWIRRQVLNRYAQSGGGAEPGVGTKAEPGPLYGVSGHAWQALANAIYFLEHFHARSPELEPVLCLNSSPSGSKSTRKPSARKRPRSRERSAV